MMHKSLLICHLFAFASLVCFASSSIVRRDYINTVCSPQVDSGDPLPPCVNIVNKQASCTPAANSPDYNAAAECLCDAPSTFFSDWLGCQACLYYHGARTEEEYDSYSLEISSVSEAYCTGSQTDYFPGVYASMANYMTFVTTAGTVLFDQAPGYTDVDLYYTGGDQTVVAATTSSKYLLVV
jgi:hypothetical protein